MSEIMTPEEKAWIDNANYEGLLYRWRFSPTGDTMFTGETGKYYSKVMFAMKNANTEEHIRASKKIGW